MKDKKMIAYQSYFEGETLRYRKRKQLILKSIGEILFIIFSIVLFYIALILINIIERGI
jgi:hypothetical protein